MIRANDLIKARRDARAARARRDPLEDGALPPGPAGRRAAAPALSPLAATGACLARSFLYSTRARRDEYWGFTLLAAGLLGLVAVVDAAAPHGLPRGASTLCLALALTPASVAVGWRRMHDIDRAGWISVLHILVFAGGALGAAAVAVAAGDRTPPADPELSLRAAFAAAAAASMVAWIFVISRLLRPTWPRNNRWGKTPNV